jgi:hypothetical protein
MRIAFVIIALLHALIHLLGFVKGLGLRDVKELTLPISRPMGFLWLAAAVLLLAYGALHALGSSYAWMMGAVAVVLSQTLVVLYWKDARFGTLPNLLILLACAVSFGHARFQTMVHGETSRMLHRNGTPAPRILHENDLAPLPPAVRQWLRSSGAVGRPFISIARVTQQAQMKMKPEQEDWMSATATQYTTMDTPAFIWTVNVRMNPFLHAEGRDMFEAGKGAMLIKVNALVNVVDEKGSQLDEGALQRYLGEMVWFPSLALSPYITWQQMDDSSALATMTYGGTTGSGTFHFNTNGDVVRFTALRYMGNGPTAKRHDWTMDITGHRSFEGIRVPSEMTSTWCLDNSDWTWLRLEVTDVSYNGNVSH